MQLRRPSAEHADAVARRLAELSAQLEAAREPAAAAAFDPAVGDEWWSDHTRVAAFPPLTVVPTVPDDPVPDEPVPDEPVPDDPVPDDPVPDHLVPDQHVLVRQSPGAPTLPVPGRHAARRAQTWLGDLVPEAVRGRVRLGSAQLTAVAVLVAVGLAVTSWWVVRADPETPVPVALEQADPSQQGAAIAPPPVDGVPPPDPSAPAAPAAPVPPVAGESAAPVTVDVAGKVQRPGIVVLDAGARVVDALERAGGARPGVDLTALNLARLLVDGEQIVVGTPVPPSAPGAPLAPAAPAVPPAGGSTAPAALVDLNLADQALLETLPQVGPVTATAIIAWRTEHGGFTSVTELLEVDGIGDATLAELTPYVTV